MQSNARRAVGVIASATALMGMCLVSSTSSMAAEATGDTLTDFGFDATAYGSKAEGASGSQSDATAVSHLPCTRFVPRDRENHVAESDRGGVQTSNVDTHNFTRQRNGITSATSTARVQEGSLVEGAVRFTDLRARNVSLHEKGKGYRVEQFSSVGSLRIAGQRVPVPTDGRTQKYSVPGEGTLILNNKSKRVSSRGAFGSVDAIKFIGDDGRVQSTAHAQSRIDGQIEGGLFKGGAWASQATVAEAVTSQRGAHQPMPCAGTYGKVLEKSTGESQESFGFLGARRSFAYGVQRDNSAQGYDRSVVDSARFGVLELRNIRGRANVTLQRDGDINANPKGTGVGRIIVAGQEQDQPPAGRAQRFPGGEYTIRLVDEDRNGIAAQGALVRLFNGTPDDRSDDTVVDLAVAKLEIRRG